MEHKRLNRIFGAAAFFVSLIVYLLTMAPTVSFWDCGEFIACSYKLAVPHPPGAPVYMLLGRFFTLIPEFLIEDIGKRVNLISVLSSAFTVLFLQLIIVYLVREFLKAQEGFMKYVPYIAGLIGALSFAFSESFWFNAVEAEVYALSMFFTSMFVWLILVWREKADDKGHERYIILIAYLMGLAMGVHILNALVLPALCIVFYFKKFELTLPSFVVMLVITGLLTAFLYPGVVKGIPWIIKLAGLGGTVGVIIAITAIYGMLANSKDPLDFHKPLAIFLLSVILITVGYSSYTMIYLRSQVNPNIDENNPETIEKFISYMNREQYGDHHFDRERRRLESPNGGKYTGEWDFFWNYQINTMYVRYFLWNFVGMEEENYLTRERRQVDFYQLFGIPLLLGLIGLVFHSRRDPENAFVIMTLFFMTGLAIVLYLNQPDPQPRERDYSYVGSFFAFSIWIGIGAAFILEWVTTTAKDISNKSIAKALPASFAILLMFISPFNMLAANYNSHDRTGNYVARDYSYNMLVSCEEGAVMFTNGDNDTFPLWYLQEVEQVRTDVRVANLSLLNTSWYISQLKNMDPKVKISFNDQQIESIGPIPWPDKKQFDFPPIPESVRRSEAQRYEIGLNKTAQPVERISFDLKPKYYFQRQDGSRAGVLRVQDIMILNILATGRLAQPVYFAVTAAEENRLDGLKDYQRMDGLLFKVTPIKGWEIDPEIMYDNLMNKFRYTNLNNPRVYFNENTIGLLQNYRTAFFRLSSFYLESGQRERFNEVVKRLYEVMPPEVIPFTNIQFQNALETFAIFAGVYPAKDFTLENYTFEQLRAIAEVGYTYKIYDIAANAYQVLINEMENNPGSLSVQNFMMRLMQGRNYLNLPEEQRTGLLNSAISQLKRQLAITYRQAGDYQTGVEFVEKWLESEPNNRAAQGELEKLKSGLEAENSSDGSK